VERFLNIQSSIFRGQIEGYCDVKSILLFGFDCQRILSVRWHVFDVYLLFGILKVDHQQKDNVSLCFYIRKIYQAPN
jgi:hypothetical protein